MGEISYLFGIRAMAQPGLLIATLNPINLDHFQNHFTTRRGDQVTWMLEPASVDLSAASLKEKMRKVGYPRDRRQKRYQKDRLEKTLFFPRVP